MARKSRRKKIEEVEFEPAIVPKPGQEAGRVGTAAYARLSAEKEDDDSIETQVEMLRQFIGQHPELELLDVYVDNGYSGTNFDRPGFIRLMDDVKSGKIHCIVVKDFSRFGRNFLETGYYLETFLPHMNVRFLSVNDGYDSSRESDRNSIVVPIRNIVNELYAKDISKKNAAYFETASKIGNKRISKETYGYLADKENNVLVADPVSAPCVRIIFRWFLAGYTTGEIAKRLSMLQVPTPFALKAEKEGRPVPESDQWRDDRIRTILQNRTYAGDTVYGKRRKMMYKNIGEHKTAPEEWIIHENTHKALVSRADFEKAQELMEMSGRKVKQDRNARIEQREEFRDYFHKKVKCMECGGIMQYSRYSRNGFDDGFDGAFYICKGKSGSKQCGQRVHEDHLKIVVMDQIRNLAVLLCDRKELSGRMRGGLPDNGKLKKLRRNLSDLKRELSRMAEARESLYENMKDGIIDWDEYQMLKEHYITGERALKCKVADAESKKRETEARINKSLELAEHLEEYLRQDGLDERMAEEFVEQILVSSTGAIEIQFTFADVLEELSEHMEGDE
ncbi:MAG: recombinase family protein [Lachnospiraceae bacterium]|nr:recombinase family protein [Lachnospiraceae bacterium]